MRFPTVVNASLCTVAPVSGGAHASDDPVSPADAVLDRHLAAFAAHDVDAVLADYHDDAVFITPQGVLTGKAQIRQLFETLIAEFDAPETRISVHERYAAGPVAYIVWSAETPAHRYPFVTDTLFVDDDRIRHQTFAAEVVAKEGR